MIVVFWLLNFQLGPLKLSESAHGTKLAVEIFLHVLESAHVDHRSNKEIQSAKKFLEGFLPGFSPSRPLSGSSSMSSLQGPWLTIRSPLTRHWATSNRHSLLYVFPSLPHTGLKLLRHFLSHGSIGEKFPNHNAI